VWAALGPLAGILIGHVLTRSWQREQWLLDCRKEEFRELISALTAATVEFLVFHTSKGTTTPQPMDVWLDAQKLAYRVIRDRIYIADEVERINVSDRYLKIAKDMREFESFDEPATRMDVLLNEIVAFAKKGSRVAATSVATYRGGCCEHRNASRRDSWATVAGCRFQGRTDYAAPNEERGRADRVPQCSRETGAFRNASQ
jgi:hypothetical protein